MKKLAFAFAFALGAAGLAADEGHKHHETAAGAAAKSEPAEAKAEAVTFTGEILDLACYMGHGGQGEKHMKCAKKCVLDGAPMGLLTPEGSVYLLVEDHMSKDAQKAYEDCKENAGGKMKVSGKLSKKGGLQTLVVAKVEKA